MHTGVVSVVPEHEEVPHAVLSGALQVPDPLQLFCWQVGASAVHSFFGSVPEVAFTQLVPVTLSTLQSPQVTPAAAQRIPDCAT